MAEFGKISQALNFYVRPQTFPVAVRMVKSVDEIPKKARLPVRDIGGAIPICQGVTLARRYGWIMALDREDISCPIGSVTLGFLSFKDKFADSSGVVPNWLKGKEAMIKFWQGLAKFEFGKYSHVVCAPLERAEFEPQVIIVYGNPAQIMRLVQGTVYEKGDPVTSVSFGAGACASYIPKTILTEQCQLVLPGGGDRIFALTQDHEMAFTIPLSKVDMVMQGLKDTHEAGMRYPITPYLKFIPEFPVEYKELLTYLKHELEV